MSMSATQMLAIINGGGSVSWNGQLITQSSQIPTQEAIDALKPIETVPTYPPAQVVQEYFIPDITATLASQELFDTVAPGLYRLLYYLEVNTAGSAGTWNVQVTYTDENGAQTITVAGPVLTALGFTSGQVIFRCIAGETIAFAINVASAAGNPVAEAHIALEQIP